MSGLPSGNTVWLGLIQCCMAEYAQVVKMLGNGRLEAMCFDGEKRLAHIRGKLRKKVRSLCHDNHVRDIMY